MILWQHMSVLCTLASTSAWNWHYSTALQCQLVWNPASPTQEFTIFPKNAQECPLSFYGLKEGVKGRLLCYKVYAYWRVCQLLHEEEQNVLYLYVVKQMCILSVLILWLHLWCLYVDDQKALLFCEWWIAAVETLLRHFPSNMLLNMPCQTLKTMLDKTWLISYPLYIAVDAGFGITLVCLLKASC